MTNSEAIKVGDYVRATFGKSVREGTVTAVVGADVSIGCWIFDTNLVDVAVVPK